MYVLQIRIREWEKWETLSKRYQTIDEAQAQMDKRPFKSMYRIAEEYTVKRYKPVKAGHK